MFGPQITLVRRHGAGAGDGERPGDLGRRPLPDRQGKRHRRSPRDRDRQRRLDGASRVHHRPEPRLRRPDLPISQQVMPERPVSIGDGSWLGHGTVVLPGAAIGRHVVIGANSVVTGHIPDYSVAAGVPARVIKTMRAARGVIVPVGDQTTEPRGGAHVGISLSSANFSMRSVIGTPFDGGLGERDVLARTQLVGVAVAVVEQDPVLGFPVGHDRLALLVGRRDGDDARRASGRAGRSTRRRGRHAPSRSADASASSARSLEVVVDADRFGSCRPGRVLDLVDRLLRGEEQRPDPEHQQQHDRAPQQHPADG